MKKLILSILLIPFSCIAQEEPEKLKLQGLSITGDKELPQVLYIVPWETHKATKITAPSFSSTLDEEFSFINKP